ncbi:ATPase family AAA domain-containing protein 2 isoform X2 [Xenopus laevis]|uniref:ATPase family AAA domain-containing protein 2 n=1 Tax=Xenopus laevis TaxID=8355 RepID=A0A8J1L0P4_XENLA|nr:ATPase family AAA domain-containing protein 2 isoform X2 [Xenopus laevis]
MVLLRSASGTPNGPVPCYRENESLLDTSSEFLSLEPQNESPELGKRRSSRTTGLNGTSQSGEGPSSENEAVGSHSQRALRKRRFEDLQNSSDKTNEMNDDKREVRRLTRRVAKQEADAGMNGNCNGELETEELVTSACETSRRTRNTEKAAAHQVNGDVEVRRSGRIRRSLYSTTNQSVLFDKLITNTAEAVLQKMDHMKKMRRRRLRELDDREVFNSTEESIDMYSRVKQKRGAAQLDEETTDNQEESGETSEEEEEQEDDEDEEEDEDEHEDDDDDDDDDDEEEEDEDGEEDNQKRYEFRQRKTVVPYQAPLAEPRSHKKSGMFYAGSASPTRRYHRFNSAGPRSPYCKRRLNRRRHAIHSSDSTSSSSDDEEHFERRMNRSRNKAISRCLPLNLQRDDLKGIQKDRMKIGASLADVDPMQIDTTVRFSSVGGLTKHIAALKEMVVFPLLYPEIFERFKIQPPRGCLFYGPPGTGKTLVARALANECSIGDRRVAFFMRKGADCLSKWIGESERQLRLLFDQAYQMRPSIIFFDEIDGLAPVRSSRQDQIHSSIVSTLLALMDGLDSRGEIVVIGATNRLDSIDPALRRPGRFDREFLFSLPDRDARKEILKIHTKEWNPKPSDLFLEELSEKCVGYCGADIKSVCAEAALCSLRRRYPQIYTTTEKLQLDINSIKITAKDFIVAMQKIVPASQRAVVSPGQALSPIIQPLLQNTLRKVLEALTKVFPHALEEIKKEKQSGHLVDEDLLYSDDEGPSVFENGLPNKTPNKPNRPFLQLNTNARNRPTSYRPRLLLAGKPGYGQGTHLAPAAIHALEKFTVYTLDLAVLFGIGATSPEETCAQLFREAKRTVPSILYIPHIHLWWETVGDTLKATFITLLRSIPSFSPILLLATSDVDHYKLPNELQELFVDDYGEVFHVQLVNKEERRAFFEDLILNQAAKAPVSKKKAVLQALEVLPLAPPPEPRTLSAQELKQLEDQEESTLRELRLFLRDVSHRLAIDKRFRAFTKPVDLEEVPDYVTVIAQPMDLSTVISKIDLHKYHTVKEYLKDIDLICSNALEYNPDKDPGDRLIRHRACTLKDATYAIIKEELDEEFEKLCEEIQESRKKRGFCASKYAPSYYYVLPKHNSTADGKKAEAEKTGQSSIPLAASTPSAAQPKRKPRRKSRWSSGNCSKRKRLLPSFKNENEKIDEEAESEVDQENPESSLDHTELELDSSVDAWNETLAADNHAENLPMQTGKATVNAEDPTSTAPEEPTKKQAETVQSPAVENSESGDVRFVRMTRGRQLQVEQQHLVSVEEAMALLSEPTPVLYVDHQQLKNLLDKAVERSDDYNVFQLEKMYALLSQCIYRHRKDYDKTLLIKEMEDEINRFKK